MKVKKTMKYKKNKNTVQIGGIFGYDLTKIAIDEGAKEYVDKLLIAKGLSQEKADLVSNKIFSDPRIVKKINMLVGKIEKAENRWMSQGRHDLIDAIPVPEVGDIINIIIDSTINTVDAAKQAKSAYDISKDIEEQITSISPDNIPSIPNTKISNVSSAASALGKKASALGKKASAMTNKAASAVGKKATAVGKKATAAANKAKGKHKGGTKKRHKKNKKTRKYRKKLSKKH